MDLKKISNPPAAGVTVDHKDTRPVSEDLIRNIGNMDTAKRNRMLFAYFGLSQHKVIGFNYERPLGGGNHEVSIYYQRIPKDQGKRPDRLT